MEKRGTCSGRVRLRRMKCNEIVRSSHAEARRDPAASRASPSLREHPASACLRETHLAESLFHA